jgi:hypothetical protein
MARLDEMIKIISYLYRNKKKKKEITKLIAR